ncbi:hypothetical protein HI914_02672 [Erysiphe necator]|nr:hypothetical protein HI914_02672 [Erysiphe necator]
MWEEKAVTLPISLSSCSGSEFETSGCGSCSNSRQNRNSVNSHGSNNEKRKAGTSIRVQLVARRPTVNNS